MVLLLPACCSLGILMALMGGVTPLSPSLLSVDSAAIYRSNVLKTVSERRGAGGADAPVAAWHSGKN